MRAGRGFGKTRAAEESVRYSVESGPAKNMVLVGATLADLRDTMFEGVSGLLAITPDWNRPDYEPSKRRLTWPNGAVATMFSAEEPDRIRGPNHDLAWCDELARWSNQREVWDMLQLMLRLRKRPRCCISTTPKRSPLLWDLISLRARESSSRAARRLRTAPAFFDSRIRKYEGTRLGRQELCAEILEDFEGALWFLDMTKRARMSTAAVPELARIVDAIDPAGSVGEDTDETAIVVAGVLADGLG